MSVSVLNSHFTGNFTLFWAILGDFGFFEARASERSERVQVVLATRP
jgi:hypothetical protein